MQLSPKVLDQFHYASGGDRAIDKVTLHQIAAFALQDVELSELFDAFGQRFDPQGVRQGDDCADDGKAGRLRFQSTHEALINL